jgi:hypothetical protein
MDSGHKKNYLVSVRSPAKVFATEPDGLQEPHRAIYALKVLRYRSRFEAPKAIMLVVSSAGPCRLGAQHNVDSGVASKA